MTRQRVLLSIAAGVAVLGYFGLPALRQIMANAAEDAEYRARAERVCPASTRGPGSTDVDTAAANALPVARTGLAFVSHGGKRQVSIVDLATGAVSRLAAGVDDPHEVAVSPDGRFGIVADFGDYQGNYEFDGQKLAVFDLAAKRLLRIVDLGDHRGPHDVTFLPGSSTRALVTTQTSRHVLEVDVATGEVVAATPTGAPGSHTLAVTADGRSAFTANEPEGSISRLDLEMRRLAGKYDVGPGPAEGIAVTPDGREIWMGFRATGDVRVIDGSNGSLLATLPGFVAPDRITMSHDGTLALISDRSCDMVKIGNVSDRRITGVIAGLPGVGSASVLPDGRVAIAALLDEARVVLVDLQTGTVLARHDLGDRIDGVAWGPDPASGGPP